MAEERAGKRIKTHDGASSSSSAAPGSEYQVFLSFRGVDTRKAFTDHLYCNLTGAGIRTFRDNEELRVGKEIGSYLLKAIEESTISIPIFSKGYACSEWCLMELTQMVKCMKSNHGHTICPIFYDVTPSDVRHQTGSFHEAFLQHTEKFNELIVQEWKEALKQVADLKGWEKDKFEDGYEGKLVDKIVIDVCMKLKKGNVYLTRDLVGMEYHVEEMTKLLDIDSGNGVRIVGIVGMGGIGKTTIAKFMYNQLCDHFQHHCCFLEDVRERVKRNNNCAEFRKQLMSDVLKRSVDGSITIERNAFREKKVLIVLDDVEKRSQMNEIIRDREYFGSGSRIIVTTRNKDVFVKSEGELLYEPSGMDDDDSLLLFCKYAFKNTQPREGYEDISREIVQTAAGLPLSLVVIGSMLFSKESKEYWEATLKKLKTIPADDVQKRLKISYDALDHGQKQIFLDIACHFVGEDKKFPFYMWEDCGFFPEIGIDALISLSLIAIEDGNVFRMHDHLRDLGRYIVYLENPNDPGQRSRLWSREEAQEVLHSQSGTRRVETFSVNYGWDYDDIISNDDFKGLSSLRYLHLEHSDLKGDFKGLVSRLRWFRLRLDPTSSLHTCGSGLRKSIMPITNFCANKLVILDLSESYISDGWESWIQIKGATNLKVLNLFRCRCLKKLPECLWNMKSMVELDLSETGIEELSEQGIGNLTNLIIFFLSSSKIKRLPDAIGKLEKLQVLDCSSCKSLEGQLPEGIGRLSSLRVLGLSGTHIDTLPEDVGSLCNLRNLNLSGTDIKKLPGVGLERLQRLEELDCSKCWLLKGQLPEGIGRLSSLRVLDLSGTHIDTLPEDVGSLCNLRELKLVSTRIKKLPEMGIERLQNLEELHCCFSLAGEVHEGIWRLSSLRVLDFSHSKITGGLPKDISGLPNLETLDLGFCERLQLPVEGLKLPLSLTKLFIPLTEASLNGVRGLVKLIDLTFCKNVGYCCEPVAEEEWRVDMPNNLEYLTLFELDDRVISCHLLPAMKFDSSSRLHCLDISDCTFETSPTGLLDLSNCQMLTILWIRNCPVIREIKGLEVLNYLEELTVKNCPLLMQPDLSNLKSLKKIDWRED